MIPSLRVVLVAAVLHLAVFHGAFAQESTPAAPVVDKAAPGPNFTYWAVVSRVVDGGTVLLNIDLGFDTWIHNRPVRLAGITAPDIHGETKAEGLKWKSRLAALLPAGAEVVLQSTKDKSDPKGGYLGTLWVDGVNINEALLGR